VLDGEAPLAEIRKATVERRTTATEQLATEEALELLRNW
jgi:hypothetical protein